ncbi:hypothetical protein I3842_Q029300 [Carya illinoinensis]|uniref:Uncharacterized protein n=1 Tax=Carya illinoinensis TaxID=32201 RepID=A0A922D0I9_CARIL|nr:hypothetical protein I3842_Q029300 [Carya illinoinensis]
MPGLFFIFLFFFYLNPLKPVLSLPPLLSLPTSHLPPPFRLFLPSRHCRRPQPDHRHRRRPQPVAHPSASTQFLCEDQFSLICNKDLLPLWLAVQFLTYLRLVMLSFCHL